MTSIFADGALHPGRDANDAPWQVVRTAAEWAGATLDGVVFDSTRTALTLMPGPIDPAALDAALAGTVIGPDGTAYRAEPAFDRVTRRRACDADWLVIAGGRGTRTGELRRPLGLALDARRELLAIADADNHRVQVVRAGGAGLPGRNVRAGRALYGRSGFAVAGGAGEVVAVLGRLDAWGQGVATGPGALAEPVAVAFARGWLVVADRAGGRIQLYDDRFRPAGGFAPVPAGAPSGFAPAPVAVAMTGCVVWVIDAAWSTPIAYQVDGDPVTDAPAPPAELAGWAGLDSFAVRGEVVHRIEGDLDELAWHRVIVDAELPPGTAVTVQTFAADAPLAPAVIPWAPARPIAIPRGGDDVPDGESDRLVLSDHERWARARGGPYLRAARPIARLAGTGPNAVDGFALAWAAARRVRVGDVLAFDRTGTPTERRPVLSISPRNLHVVLVSGDAVTYAADATLILVERDGAEPYGGPRVIAALGPTISIQLAGAAADGTLYPVAATHAAAALLQPGDLVRLVDPVAATEATIAVHAIDPGPTGIVLAAAVTADFSTCDVRIAETTDRLVVDALPWSTDVAAGEPIVIHEDLGTAAPTVAAIRWVDPALGTVWLEPGPIVPYATWTRFTLVEPAATDRGRFLWIRLVLRGAVAHAGDPIATATPVVRRLRLLRPRPTYLRYLPAVFARRDADDPTGALFLERFLALPERRLTAIEAEYEAVAREVNPQASSPDWLAFLATWFGLVFDPSWPPARRRELVVHAHELFARRGTVWGLARYLEIYTGTAPAIIEGFQHRVNAAPRTLIGGDAVLGRAALGPPPPPAAAAAEDSALAHTFSIWVFGDDAACGAALTEKAARAIIDSVKPAHTRYELFVVAGAPRVGISTTVGVDTVLIGGELPPSPLGLGPEPPATLGRLHLPAPRRAAAAPTLGSIPIDDDLTLT
jgi:phage tail-like protein